MIGGIDFSSLFWGKASGRASGIGWKITILSHTVFAGIQLAYQRKGTIKTIIGWLYQQLGGVKIKTQLLQDLIKPLLYTWALNSTLGILINSPTQSSCDAFTDTVLGHNVFTGGQKLGEMLVLAILCLNNHFQDNTSSVINIQETTWR